MTDPAEDGIDGEPTDESGRGGDAVAGLRGGPSRRSLLSTIAAGTASGIAGCSAILGGVTSVEATPMILYPDGQDLLGLPETTVEKLTRTVSPANVSGEITATSYLALHRPTRAAEQLAMRFDVAEPSAHAMGVLAMPAPDSLGNQLNPFADKPFRELLVGDRGRRLIARTDAVDAPAFDWRRDPRRVGTTDVELLNTSKTAETYLGVAADGEDATTVLSQFARVEHEGDVVLVVEFAWRPTPAEPLASERECVDDKCQVPNKALGPVQISFGRGLQFVAPCSPLSKNYDAIQKLCGSSPPDPFDPTDLPPPATLGIRNARIVQQVEDTVVKEPNSSPTYSEGDPPYVKGEDSAVVFEFDTLDNLATIGSNGSFMIDVFSGKPGGTARYEFEGTIEFSGQDLQDIDGGEHTISVLHDLSQSGSGGNPVFELETGDVKLSPRPSLGLIGLVNDSGVAKTISVSSNNIKSVNPMKIGFVPLRDAPPAGNKNPGDRYGNANGKPRAPKKTFEAATRYLQGVYPGDIVTYLHGVPVHGDATKLAGGVRKEMVQAKKWLNSVATNGQFFPHGGTLRLDGRKRSTMVSDMRSNGFDAVVVIVPGVAKNNSNASNYYDYHYDNELADAIGLAFGPKAAVSIAGESGSSGYASIGHTVAQEVGHYFQDNYLDPAPDHPMAQRRQDDNPFTPHGGQGRPLDPSHARNQNSNHRDRNRDSDPAMEVDRPTDHPGVVSVGYELDGEFSNVQKFNLGPSNLTVIGPSWHVPPAVERVPSYMSYTNDTDTAWADARIHKQLIEAGSGKDWTADKLVGGGNARFMLSGTGSVTDQGGVRYDSVLALPSVNHYVDDEDNPVEVALLGPADEVLVRVRVPVKVRPSHGHLSVAKQPSFDLPFERPGVRVRTTYEGRTTFMNPVVRCVRDAVGRLPRAAFGDDPDAARERIGAALEEVAAAMEAGAYGEAANAMDGPVRERIEDALVEYEAALGYRSREALLDLLDRMVERLATIGG